MAQKKRKPATPAVALDIKDLEQVAGALARVRDPMMRYMLTMFIDLASERIAQLETQTSSASAVHVATTTQH